MTDHWTRTLPALAIGAALAISLTGGEAIAQAASARGLVGSGVAGPMTAHGGVGDQINAGRAIPYARPQLGGVTRPSRPPRRFGGYGPLGGYGEGYPGVHGPFAGGRRDWVYDRPWTRYPYAPGPY